MLWNVISFSPGREGTDQGDFRTKSAAMAHASFLADRYGSSLTKIEVWNRKTGTTYIVACKG